jgi:drug/metabolite transporter (DMT)-like permease
VNPANAQRSGLILLAGLALGSSASVARLGVLEIHPITFVVLRFAVATLAFAVTLPLFRIRLPGDSRTWRDILIVGLTQGFQLLVFTIALQFISSAVLTIFIALVPLFTAIMAQLWLTQERLTLRNWLGLVTAFAGVLLLIFTRTSGLTGLSTGFELRGQLLALTGALVSAAGVVYARLRLREVNAVVVTAGQMVTGLLLTLPFAMFLSSTDLSAISWRGWFATLFTALIGSYLGFLLLFYMVKRYGATTSVLPAYLMPPVSATIGALFLGEIITPSLVAGAGLILFGLFLASE